MDFQGQVLTNDDTEAAGGATARPRMVVIGNGMAG